MSWVAEVTIALFQLMLENEKVFEYFNKFPSRDFIGGKFFDFIPKFCKSYPGSGGKK